MTEEWEKPEKMNHSGTGCYSAGYSSTGDASAGDCSAGDSRSPAGYLRSYEPFSLSRSASEREPDDRRSIDSAFIHSNDFPLVQGGFASLIKYVIMEIFLIGCLKFRKTPFSLRM